MSKPNSHSISAYVAGFGLSLLLTAAAFLLVQRHSFSHRGLVAAIAALAVLQLLVQLVFFLNLDQERRPRWNLQAAIFALTVVVIIVGGSIWIMNNLNYHMTTPAEVNKYLQSQDGL
jgi:cytochrome o ubiquinol oxidase operon protein cyoD